MDLIAWERVKHEGFSVKTDDEEEFWALLERK